MARNGKLIAGTSTGQHAFPQIDVLWPQLHYAWLAHKFRVLKTLLVEVSIWTSR